MLEPTEKAFNETGRLGGNIEDRGYYGPVMKQDIPL